MGRTNIDVLLARIEALEAQNRERTEEIRELRLKSSDQHDTAERRNDERVSRRRVLGMASAAAAGAAGTAIATAVPAGAAAGGPVLMVNNNDAQGNQTKITSTNATNTFEGQNTSGTGPGVSGVGATGVVGSANTAPGTGVKGFGGGTGGVGLSGNAAFGLSLLLDGPSGQDGTHMRLVPHPTVTGPPTSTLHQRGEFWLDANGLLFQCVSTGMPGTWIRQSPLVLLSAPVRMHDSRVSMGGPGPLGTNGTRDVTVTNGTTIPDGVSAVLVNLTAINPSAKSFMSIYKQGIAFPGTSNINYSAGATISNNATCAVSATNKVTVRNGASTCDFALDVFAYYP